VLLEWLMILLRSARRRWQRRLRGIMQTLLIPAGAVAGLLSNYAANALQAPPGLSASAWHGLVLGTFLVLMALLMILAPAAEWRRAQARLTNPDRQRFLQLLDSSYFAYVKDPLQGMVRAALGVQELPTVVRQLERGESPAQTVGDPPADPVAQGVTSDQHETTENTRHDRDEYSIITLPPGGTLRGLYGTTGGQMVILGEPGAGKSTQLQALGRELVREALADRQLPMPVILDVSTWAEDPDTQVELWLAKAIKKTYGVLEKTAAAWVNEQQIAPLLDALDVMVENDRAPCVKAINDYHARHPENPLVVCCRKEEYEELRTHLELRDAVVLLPLTDAAIDEELASGGQRQVTLRTIVSRDERLRDALRTPLILNLVMFTYCSLPADEIPQVDDVEAWRRELFRHYVDLMLGDARGQAPGHRPGIWEAEQRLRTRLAQTKQTIPDQMNKPTSRPTMRWVFQCFEGIELLHIYTSGLVTTVALRLQPLHEQILALLGPPYQYLYRTTR
jgi:hypothetical protein